MKKKKNKVLYIATVAKKRNRLDGETVKCKQLEEYLNNQEEIEIKTIDTDNWKKHIVKLVVLIICGYLWSDKIVISCADRGAHIVLNFFNIIKNKKAIYYFVIGGRLYSNICENRWNIDNYKVEKIYVESNILLKKLKSLGVSNVKLLNNFRNINDFKNYYEKDDVIRFVYYGRVIKEKGVEEAIKLIKKVNEEDNIKCSLTIYGQVDKDYLKLIYSMFDNNIKYFGEIKPDGKIEYEELSKYDIFIFPTEYPGECLPGALIDAYISGLAVVVSNWEYAQEYVKNNFNGKIFDYKNYEDMYIKTKELILSNKLSEFKKNSQELSKLYEINRVLFEFKEELLGFDVKRRD